MLKKIDSIISVVISEFMKQIEEKSKEHSGGIFGSIIKTEVKMSKSKIFSVVLMLNDLKKLKINKLV